MELTSVCQSRPPEVKSTQHKQNTALTIKEQDVIHCNLLLITESPRQTTTEQLFFLLMYPGVQEIERFILKFNMLIIRKWKDMEEGFSKWVDKFYVLNRQRKPFQL